MRFTLSMLIILLIISSCKSKKSPIRHALKSQEVAITNVIDNIEIYEVQIMLSEIIRTNKAVKFKDYNFNVNDNDYYYPASTVKFPVALLALEKINKLPVVTSQNHYTIIGDTLDKHSIRQDISKIFAVSDNASFNRLYEFLGRDYINSELRKKNIGPMRISHRLSVPNSDIAERLQLSFTRSDGSIFENKTSEDSKIDKIELNRLQKGQGYYRDSTLVRETMDFSEKNYLPISTLHNLMKRTIFPEVFSVNEIFNISPSDREFLLKAMSSLPRGAGYDSEEYYDSYVKFFMFGNTKENIPNHIKIYNKVGYAYGYLTDCAYIKDEKSQLEFILTATIHVNKNGIFNDDTYEYQSVGIPFLAHLAKEIHNHLTPKE